MFPGAGAQVYYNEAGEVLGWDYPSFDDPYEPDDCYIDADEPQTPCREPGCPGKLYGDEEDECCPKCGWDQQDEGE